MTSERVPVRLPVRDLVADLILEADPEFGERELRAEPRHLRLYVAGSMLSDGTDQGDRAGLRRALQLYEFAGQALLDDPRLLTTSDIATEVLRLLGDRAAIVSEDEPRVPTTPEPVELEKPVQPPARPRPPEGAIQIVTPDGTWWAEPGGAEIREETG